MPPPKDSPTRTTGLAAERLDYALHRLGVERSVYSPSIRSLVPYPGRSGAMTRYRRTAAGSPPPRRASPSPRRRRAAARWRRRRPRRSGTSRPPRSRGCAFSQSGRPPRLPSFSSGNHGFTWRDKRSRFFDDTIPSPRTQAVKHVDIFCRQRNCSPGFHHLASSALPPIFTTWQAMHTCMIWCLASRACTYRFYKLASMSGWLFSTLQAVY